MVVNFLNHITWFCCCRILGLPSFVSVDCQKPWTIVMSPDIPFTYYLDVGLLLFFYFVLALEIRHRLDPVCLSAYILTVQLGFVMIWFLIHLCALATCYCLYIVSSLSLLLVLLHLTWISYKLWISVIEAMLMYYADSCQCYYLLSHCSENRISIRLYMIKLMQ